MSMTTCKECGKDISDQAAACPHCGAPTKPIEDRQSGILQCPECKLNLVPIERREGYSFIAFLGLLLFLSGLGALLFNPMIGLFMILIGALADRFGRSKKLHMVCPSCRYDAPDTSSIGYQVSAQLGSLWNLLTK